MSLKALEHLLYTAAIRNEKTLTSTQEELINQAFGILDKSLDKIIQPAITGLTFPQIKELITTHQITVNNLTPTNTIFLKRMYLFQALVYLQNTNQLANA